MQIPSRGKDDNNAETAESGVSLAWLLRLDVRLELPARRILELCVTQEQKRSGQTENRSDDGPQITSDAQSEKRAYEQQQQRQSIGDQCPRANSAIRNRYTDLLANNRSFWIKHTKFGRSTAKHPSDIYASTPPGFITTATSRVIHPNESVISVKRSNNSFCIYHTKRCTQ